MFYWEVVLRQRVVMTTLDRGVERPVLSCGCPLTGCGPCASGFTPGSSFLVGRMESWTGRSLRSLSALAWEGSVELLMRFHGYRNASITWGVEKHSSCPGTLLRHHCRVHCRVCRRASRNTPARSSSPRGLEWKITFQRLSRQQWPLVTFIPSVHVNEKQVLPP